MKSIHLEWKELQDREGQTVIYIVVTGIGEIELSDIVPYFTQLNKTLEHIRKYHKDKRFVMVFDLSQCTKYPKLSLLPHVSKLRTTNDDLFNTALLHTHILLKDPLDTFFTKVLFTFAPGKRPHYVNKLESAIYQVIKH